MKIQSKKFIFLCLFLAAVSINAEIPAGTDQVEEITESAKGTITIIEDVMPSNPPPVFFSGRTPAGHSLQ